MATFKNEDATQKRTIMTTSPTFWERILLLAGLNFISTFLLYISLTGLTGVGVTIAPSALGGPGSYIFLLVAGTLIWAGTFIGMLKSRKYMASTLKQELETPEDTINREKKERRPFWLVTLFCLSTITIIAALGFNPLLLTPSAPMSSLGLGLLFVLLAGIAAAIAIGARFNSEGDAVITTQDEEDGQYVRGRPNFFQELFASISAHPWRSAFIIGGIATYVTAFGMYASGTTILPSFGGAIGGYASYSVTLLITLFLPVLFYAFYFAAKIFKYRKHARLVDQQAEAGDPSTIRSLLLEQAEDDKDNQLKTWAISYIPRTAALAAIEVAVARRLETKGQHAALAALEKELAEVKAQLDPQTFPKDASSYIAPTEFNLKMLNLACQVSCTPAVMVLFDQLGRVPTQETIETAQQSPNGDAFLRELYILSDGEKVKGVTWPKVDEKETAKAFTVPQLPDAKLPATTKVFHAMWYEPGILVPGKTPHENYSDTFKKKEAKGSSENPQAAQLMELLASLSSVQAAEQLDDTDLTKPQKLDGAQDSFIALARKHKKESLAKKAEQVFGRGSSPAVIHIRISATSPQTSHGHITTVHTAPSSSSSSATPPPLPSSASAAPQSGPPARGAPAAKPQGDDSDD